MMMQLQDREAIAIRDKYTHIPEKRLDMIGVNGDATARKGFVL